MTKALRFGKNIVKLCWLGVSALMGLMLLVIVLVVSCLKRESVFKDHDGI